MQARKSEYAYVKMIWTFFLITLFLQCGLIKGFAQLTKSGPITGSEIWSGQITLTGDVIITSTGKLTITAGTIVSAAPGTDDQAGGANSSRVELIVDGGELRVEGDVNNPVVFTTTGVAGDWYGIRIVKQAAGISIRNCIIDKAINGLEVLSVQPDALPAIEALTVQNSTNVGIYIKVGNILSPDTPLFKNCLLKSNPTGLFIDNSQNVLFEGCEFSYNRDWGVSLGNYNNLTFKDCVIRKNGRDGITGGWNSVTLRNCIVEYNGGNGCATYGGSITLENSRVQNNGGRGISADYGSVSILNCVVSSNGDWGVVGGPVVMRGCEVVGNGSGVSSSDGQVTIVDSVLKDNRGWGLYIGGGDTSMEGIKRNKITGNKRGIGFGGVANPLSRVEGNDIYGNEEYEAVNDGGSAIQTENTYWGEPTTSEIQNQLQQGGIITYLSKIFDSRHDNSKGCIIIKSYRATQDGSPIVVTQGKSGIIVGQETWSGTVILGGDITIKPGGSVKILAGTVVKSIGAYDDQAGGANSSRVELIVDGGELRVEGDVNNPVVFTTTGVAGDWYGIRIVKQAAGISIRNCIIDKAINGLEVLSVQPDALPAIEALTVQNSTNVGIYIKVGNILSPDTPLFKNCLLKSNPTGLFIDNSQNVLFEGCEFSYNRDWGVSLGNYNNLTFKDCVIRKNGRDGITGGWNSVTLRNCIVEYNGGNGCATYGGSITLENSRVQNNGGRGISADYGSVSILNCVVSSNGDWGVVGGPVVMRGCEVVGNGSGVSSSDGQVTIVDSVLKDNRGWGLYIGGGDTSMEGIKRNKITGNKRGIGFGGVANPLCRVEGNDIYGNEEYEAVNDGGSAIQTENTYWGEPTTSEIQQGKANLSKIFDKADDPNRGEIKIVSYRTGPLTPNEPPSTPVLSSPADGATVSPTPTFRIKANDPEGGQLKYAIQIFQNNQVVKTFDQRISPAGWSKTSYASGEIAEFTVPIDQALSEGVYQWRALAFDQEGTQSASALHSFKVQATNQPPLKPLALTPSNNETVSGNPSFVFATYDPDNDNFWCILEIWQGDNRLRVYDQRQDATGWSKATFSYEDTKYFNLPEGFALPAGNYKWRVKAIDAKGLESEWSEFANFVVDPALAPTPLVTFQLPVSLHIGQEDHSFVFFLNTTSQPWEGFSFIRLKLQSQQGVSKVAYRIWTVDKAGKAIILSNGETSDEVNVPTEFIPPVEPGELRAFVVSIKPIPESTKIEQRIGPGGLILIAVCIYAAAEFYIAREMVEVGGETFLTEGVMTTFAKEGYDIDKVTAGKVVKAIRDGLKERSKMSWVDKLSEIDFLYSVASKAYKLYEGEFPISPQDVAIGVLKKSVVNFLKEADNMIKSGEYIDKELKKVLEKNRWEIEKVLEMDSSQPSSKLIGPTQYAKSNQTLRYIAYFNPASLTKARAGEITEIEISNPLDPNIDINSIKFEGVSHPTALTDQCIDIQKREARWRFNLADIGSDELWVQFSALPMSNLASGTQIHNRAIIKLKDAEDQTNEVVTTIDNTSPKAVMQPLSPVQPSFRFPVQWMCQDDIGEVDKVEIWVSDDGGEPELWAIFPSSTTTAIFQGKFGHTYGFYPVAIDKAGNYSDLPEEPSATTKAGEAPPIEKGLNLVTLPLISEITDPKKIFNFEEQKWAWYDPIAKKYVYYPDSSASSLQPGKAYWCFLATKVVPNAKGDPINEFQPFVISLKQGWNIIGNPWLVSLPWELSSIRVRVNGEEKTLKEAQEKGWVEDYAWGWDGSKYQLVYDSTILPNVTSKLEPWRGFWMFAKTDCELILPSPTKKSIKQLREKQVIGNNRWTMRLQVRIGSESGEVLLGVVPGTRRMAIGLPPIPPIVGQTGLQVMLLDGGTPLAVDVRPEQGQKQEWELLIRWNDKITNTSEVVMTFEGVGYAPKGLGVWLVDTISNKRIYLRTTASYRFIPAFGETEHRFKIIAERESSSLPWITNLRTVTNRGEGAIICFSLAKPAQVRLEIQNLAGRRIAELVSGEVRQAGEQKFVWQGTDSAGRKLPSGVYIVRVVARDEENRWAQAITMLTLR